MQKNHKLTDFLETFRKEAFLQSEAWRKLQESEGSVTHHFEDFSKSKNKEIVFRIWANIIEHKLPIVGKYFYIPRGPVIRGQKEVNLTRVEDMKKSLDYLVWLAKDNEAGWIRFDARSNKDLNLIKEAALKMSKGESVRIKKAPHNMQPKEIFVVDVSKSEDELLSEMKSKTRYNIGVAKKKGVSVRVISNEAPNEGHPESSEGSRDSSASPQNDSKKYYLEEFLKLNRETAERSGIVTHPDSHYRKMVEIIPQEVLEIYVAEYEGKVIAVNLVVFFGDTAIYLHGASSNEHRDAMAPYLLQWKQIQDAKAKGCKWYDFGGIETQKNAEDDGKTQKTRKWAGITKFKTGFSPKTEPIVFPGSYDIVVNPWKYDVYRVLQKIKGILMKVRK